MIKKILLMLLIGANTIICILQNIITKSNVWYFAIVPAFFGIFNLFILIGVFNRREVDPYACIIKLNTD